MIALLVLAFLVMPIVELVVIARVASEIGVAETILVLLTISVAGAWLCKREGLGAWRRIQASLSRYELPHRELLDGGLILVAGALLLTPGFLTDVIGLLLLVPPTRVIVRTGMLRSLRQRTRVQVAVRNVHDVRGWETGDGRFGDERS